MSDDDKTPVVKPPITPEFERACKRALDAVGVLPQACGAPIRDRSGRDLGYVCNLSKGHLGKHAEVEEPHDPWSLPAGPK